jgi:hypothetical protein
MNKRRWKHALLAAWIAAAGGAWSGSAWAAGASVDTASAKQKAEAKEKYQQGMRAFEAGKFEEALKGFEQSYDTVASPNSHLMIARTLIRLGQRVAAYRMLDEVVKEAKAAKDQAKYGKTARAARAEQEQLGRQLAFVTVEFGGATLNGEEIPPGQWHTPIAMEPGTVDIVIRTKAGGEEHHQVKLEAGENRSISPTPPVVQQQGSPAAVLPNAPAPPPEAAPAAPPSVSLWTVGYVATGVGLAGMAAFTIFGLVNNSTYSDLEAECPDRRCPERLAGTAENGRTYQTLANVGLGVGIVGLGSALALFLAGSPSKSSEAATTTAATRIVVGPRFVSVAGGF